MVCESVCRLLGRRSHTHSDPLLCSGDVTCQVSQQDAQNLARASINRILRECNDLAELTLPADAMQILVELRRNARALQDRLGRVEPGMVLPWARPPPEEQVLWDRLCPDGGRLLRTQVCVASEGDAREEWYIGQLFASFGGLLFQGASEQDMRTGLIRWTLVKGIEISRTCDTLTMHEAEVILADTFPMKSLRLQLGSGSSSDASWLQKAWQLSESAAAYQNLEISAFSFSGADRQEFASFESFGSEDENQDVEDDEATPSDAGDRNSFMADVASMPSEMTPVGKVIWERRLENATTSTIRTLLEAEDYIFDSYLRDTLKCTNIRTTPWIPERGNPESLVRRSQYVLPLPQDVPPAVSKLLGVPSHADVTTVTRLHSTSEEILLSQRTCSKGVPFSENFIQGATLQFLPHVDGGVVLSFWSQNSWIGLPWYAAPVKPFVDKKVTDEAIASSDAIGNLFDLPSDN
eukprot:TRINITY_DN31750_c0_g1_i1.p1 TRINITY_DN31750_c0_g1~~TRINITY_DN31750_c0_g1_i1.p1  ORF type:complete len:465 (-),score=72.61 TRINITY_DN31750_c0_g1_i1:81-1475(-)